MENGTHQMQLMPAAGAARQASRIRPSASWSTAPASAQVCSPPRSRAPTW